MTDPVPVYNEILHFAQPYIKPLFLQDFFFRTGRSATTPTATGTFVHRKGQIYCVTCRHVVDAVASPYFNTQTSKGALALALDAGAIVLGTPKQSCFASPVQALQQPEIDVAIARIPWGDWDTLKRDRERLAYIDFDTFKASDYSKFLSCGAVGFPDKRKEDRDGRIKVGIAVAVVGLTRPINTHESTFQLHSKLDQPHCVGFSGMSGGLVLGIASRDEYVPFGIVFEGSPSGEEEYMGSIVGPRDIFLRCNLLTPEIFDGWLERTHFPNVSPIFMAVAD